MRSWKAEQIAWTLLVLATALLVGMAWWQRAPIVHYLTETGRDATLGRAQRLEAEGEMQAAGALYAELAVRYPEREDVLAAYASFLDRQGRPDDAELLYARAAALGRAGSQGVAAYGTFLHRRARMEEAVALYEKHTARYPGDAESRLRLAKLLSEAGRAEEALAHFQAAAAVPGLDFDAARGLGAAHWELGRAKEAVAAWQRAVRMPLPSNEGLQPHTYRGAEQTALRFDLARAQAELGEWELALADYSAYLAYFPNSWLALRGALAAARALDREPDPGWEHALAALSPGTLIDAPLSSELLLVGVDVAESAEGRANALRLMLHLAARKTFSDSPALQFYVQRADATGRRGISASPHRLDARTHLSGTSILLPVRVDLPVALEELVLHVSTEDAGTALVRVPAGSRPAQ